MAEMKKLNWKYSSPEKQGFHRVISPENSDCKTTWGFRLNLDAGDEYLLQDDLLELNGAIISGAASLQFEGESHMLSARDAFYLPG